MHIICGLCVNYSQPEPLCSTAAPQQGLSGCCCLVPVVTAHFPAL